MEAEKVDLYNTQAFRSPGAIVPYGALFYVGYRRVGAMAGGVLGVFFYAWSNKMWVIL